LIEQEIAARNFFLYCESAAAERSEWVRRERATVADVARKKPVRIGHVNVEGEELARAALDDFLAKTRIFPSYSSRDRETVAPFLLALSQAGFQISSAADFAPGERWQQRLNLEIQQAARNGWVLAFVSRNSIDSLWANADVRMAGNLNARIIPVQLDSTLPPP
jgi:hypothetical protein